MYRTADPRFRRRLNEIENRLERANETAQSNIYVFGQAYLKPCIGAITTCLVSCMRSSCPCLELHNNRSHRPKERSRLSNRPELSFDFYDDWDDDESDALLGWSEDSDALVGSTSTYGAVTENNQPVNQNGMRYSRVIRKSTTLHSNGPSDGVKSVRSSLLARLFGGARESDYTPSVAGLQERPGKRRRTMENNGDVLGLSGVRSETRRPRVDRASRMRSVTVSSGHTTDSYSSRGDLFPSDNEDDAIPIDEEFAIVLERRTIVPNEHTLQSDLDLPLSPGNRRNSYQSEWSLTGEHDLAKDTTSDSLSVGNKGDAAGITHSAGGSPKQTAIDQAAQDSNSSDT